MINKQKHKSNIGVTLSSFITCNRWGLEKERAITY